MGHNGVTRCRDGQAGGSPVIMRGKERQARGALGDALLVLAASLQEAAGPEDALDRLTRKLADRGVGCALFVQSADGQSFQLERSTLPLTPDVWGRALRLPRLAPALARGRPLVYADAAAPFAEGGHPSLLTDKVAGNLIAAPLRLPAGGGVAGSGAVLCLVARELAESGRDAAWGLAAMVDCRGAEDVTTVYGPEGVTPGSASSTAAGALDAFLKLTGDKHNR